MNPMNRGSRLRIAATALALAAGLSILSQAAPARARGSEPPPIAHLDDDGMLVMRGERTFMFGCYWNPGTPEGLRQLREAGFNLVSSKAEREALDAVAAAGLLAWIPLGGRMAVAGDAAEQQLERLVAELRDHPALAVWEVPDEALWNVWYGRQKRLATERSKLRELLRERTKSGKDVGQAPALIAEEAQCRARADFERAEELERQIRRLLDAPPQDPDVQMSAAPEAAEQLRRRLLRGYRTIKRLDGRPVWMNYAPRNTIDDMRRFAEAADIVGCDIYPVPVQHSQGHSDLANRGLTSVGDYTDRFLRVGDGRPVWMVLQGFGWRDIHEHPADAPPEKGRRPTRSESRFMLYDAIVHGARGVLYWGCNYAQEPPEFWNELRGVVREAADLAGVWAARDAAVQPQVSYLPTMGSVDRPPLALAKQRDDKTHILVVNEHYGGLGVRLSGLRGLDGARASLAGDASGCALKSNRVEQGTLIIHMPGRSAAVVALENGGAK